MTGKSPYKIRAGRSFDGDPRLILELPGMDPDDANTLFDDLLAFLESRGAETEKVH